MAVTAAILFTFAALGGITLASMHLSGKHVRLWMAMLHGGLALPAIVLLIWSTYIQRFPALQTTALLLFLIAAIGGAYMFLTHGKKRALPKPLIIGHGCLALAGYITLLLSL